MHSNWSLFTAQHCTHVRAFYHINDGDIFTTTASNQAWKKTGLFPPATLAAAILSNFFKDTVTKNFVFGIVWCSDSLLQSLREVVYTVINRTFEWAQNLYMLYKRNRAKRTSNNVILRTLKLTYRKFWKMF